MSKGGVKTKYFRCPSNPPSLCGSTLESLIELLLLPMIPPSCPPALAKTQSFGGEGWDKGVFVRWDDYLRLFGHIGDESYGRSIGIV
jgi:hypothetical protein